VKKKLMMLVVGIVVLAIFCYEQNNLLKTTRITVYSKNLPKAFEGMRVVHLSDLHGKVFGANQSTLVKKIKAEKPDLIVFTGDMVDKRDFDEKPGLVLMRELKTVAPVYFVLGNHEAWANHWDELKAQLKNEDVTVLENEGVVLTRGDSSIWVFGMSDPKSKAGQKEKLYAQKVLSIGEKAFEKAKRSIDEKNQGAADMKSLEYKLLLSHRPELFPFYKEYGYDMIFSGHTHGGQVRLPLVGGIVAPSQGLFPKYYAGLYTDGNSNMVISCGLGNSIIPQRLFNRPELVVVTLKNELNH